MSKGKLLAVCCVWLVLIGIGAVVWRAWLAPAREQERIDQTTPEAHYKHQVNLALDSFSGYCVLRSKSFRNQLSAEHVKLNLVDDGADYPERLRKLKSGDVQMAAFTVDALIKASAELGEMPATIVAIIDETRGADAMVAYKSAFPNLDALNRPDVKIVLTPDSPSETLARVVQAHFNLERLGPNPFVPAADAEGVYQRYRAAKPAGREVFVLWEPYVSKVLENPNTHVLIDSSGFRGYIVDVLVANRDFLIKNEDVAREVVRAYFTALYEHRGDMAKLVREDAQAAGTSLSDSQVERLVGGIWWKNTQENYAHFGLMESQPLQHLEDMIGNITGVLRQTGGISIDPTGGQPNRLYFPELLRGLREGGFHPGVTEESIRDDQLVLPALSDREWQRLAEEGEVGEFSVPPLVFPRGHSRLTEYSETTLDGLIETLKNFPRYYVLIRGNALTEADKPLATARAEAAADYLVKNGVHPNRVRAVGVKPSGATSVSFVLGQTSY